MRRGVRREAGVAIWVQPQTSERTREPRKPARGKIHTPTLSARNALRMGHPDISTYSTRRGMGMDITWLTDRIAVGGGIWNADNMAKVAREGITHIIDMQIEFDDTPLAAEQGITVLWNPTDDDFEAKPAELFQRGVEFAQAALERQDAKLFIHCAAGVHRAPMMALALLGSMGWNLDEAMDLIQERRPVADFAEVYVRSVEEFLGKA
jgi:protein-tyrosine phosphatase